MRRYSPKELVDVYVDMNTYSCAHVFACICMYALDMDTYGNKSIGGWRSVLRPGLSPSRAPLIDITPHSSRAATYLSATFLSILFHHGQ